jgi:hypothetical protein
MTEQVNTFAPPKCPRCNEDGVESEVLLVEHGYHMGPVRWDATVSDWVVADEAQWNLSWNNVETYWQCNTCFWQGGDPIGLEDDDDDE